MIKIIDQDTVSWNTHATHAMQSWQWGLVRAREGKTVLRFVQTSSEGSVTNVYQMTLHPIPYTKYFVGYIPKSNLPDAEFLEYLQSFCNARHIAMVKFEPNALLEQNLQIPNLLTKSSNELFTPWNQVLDLTKSEDDLLAAMHHKTRYNIRLASKKGVVVEAQNDAAGYKTFEDLYFATCKRQNYRGHTPAYHQNIWSCLSHDTQNTRDELQNYILVAHLGGIALGAYQLWRFKDTMYYTYGGSSEVERGVMAPNLLMWETIRFARLVGCKLLDMWGSLRPDFPGSDPYAGFTRFKAGYGTKFVQYVGTYDLVINKLIYAIFTLYQKFRT